MSASSVVELPAYQLNPGTFLYKGDTRKYLDQFVKGIPVSFDADQGPVFFAFSPGVAKTYGVALKFEVREPFFVIDMDNIHVVQNLYNMAEPYIRAIMRKNYGYIPDTTELGNRVSDPEADRIFSQFLCEKNLHGYALKHAPTDFQGTFHPEIMICDTSKLTFLGTVDEISSEEQGKDIETLQSDLLAKQVAKDLKESRKSRSRLGQGPDLGPGAVPDLGPGQGLGHDTVARSLF